MDNLDLIISIIEFIIGIVFLSKLFFGVAKSFKWKGLFWFTLSLWIMYELSKIEIAFGLDALDIVFILAILIFAVWALKPLMEQDLLIRETDKIIEKLNDRNYNPSEEELNRQGGFLSEQEKHEIKQKYISDNFKILFGIILTCAAIAIVGCLICLLLFGKINSDKLGLTVTILAYILVFVAIIILTIKSLHNQDAKIRNAAKKDLPFIIAVLTIAFVGGFAIWYVFIGVYL